jgi:hypothetical protein
MLISRIAGVTLLKRRDPGALCHLASAPIVLRELTDVGNQAAIDEAQDAMHEFTHIGNAHFNDPILNIHVLAHAVQLADHQPGISTSPTIRSAAPAFASRKNATCASLKPDARRSGKDREAAGCSWHGEAEAGGGL